MLVNFYKKNKNFNKKKIQNYSKGKKNLPLSSEHFFENKFFFFIIKKRLPLNYFISFDKIKAARPLFKYFNLPLPKRIYDSNFKLEKKNIKFTFFYKKRIFIFTFSLCFVKKNKLAKSVIRTVRVFYSKPKFLESYFSLFKYFFTDGKLVLLKKQFNINLYILNFSGCTVHYDIPKLYKYFYVFFSFKLSKIYPISIQGVQNFFISLGDLTERFLNRWKEWGLSSFFFKKKLQKTVNKKLNVQIGEEDDIEESLSIIPKNFLRVNGNRNPILFKRIIKKLYLLSLFSDKLNFKVKFLFLKFLKKLFKRYNKKKISQFVIFFKSLFYFSILSKVSTGFLRFFFFLDFYFKKYSSSIENIISPLVPFRFDNDILLDEIARGIEKATFLRKSYWDYYKRTKGRRKFFVITKDSLRGKSLLNFMLPRFILKNGLFNKSFLFYLNLLANFTSFYFDKNKSENFFVNLLNSYETKWAPKKVFHKRRLTTVMRVVFKKKQRFRQTYKVFFKFIKSNKELTRSFLSELAPESLNVFFNRYSNFVEVFLNRINEQQRINENTFYLVLSGLNPSKKRRRTKIKWQ